MTPLREKIKQKSYEDGITPEELKVIEDDLSPELKVLIERGKAIKGTCGSPRGSLMGY